METKKCTKCGRELPTTEFYVNKRNKDGLCNCCKECQHQIYLNSKNKTKVATTKNNVRKANLALSPNGERKCSKCGKVLPISEFYSGHTRCKSCESQIESKRILVKKHNKKVKLIKDACNELNLPMDEDMMKLGMRLLSNRTRKSRASTNND